MLNIIKMDIYRMFKTKSLYVIWAIMISVILLSTGGVLIGSKESTNLQENNEISEETEKMDNLSPGMVMTLTSNGEDITLLEIIYSNIQVKIIALFIVIFVCIFTSADISSGYIKNFGGQLKRSSSLVISKAISLLLYTVLTIALTVIFLTLCSIVFAPNLIWGNPLDIFAYIGLEVLLYYALSIIVMMATILLRSTVWSIIFAISVCMNVMTILYSAIDKIISKVGLGEIHLIKYTISGKISFLPMNVTSQDAWEVVFASLIFILIASQISAIIYKKRDFC